MQREKEREKDRNIVQFFSCACNSLEIFNFGILAEIPQTKRQNVKNRKRLLNYRRDFEDVLVSPPQSKHVNVIWQAT